MLDNARRLLITVDQQRTLFSYIVSLRDVAKIGEKCLYNKNK